MTYIKSRAHHVAKCAEPDEVSIDRACSGELTRLYSNELAVAIHRLLALGMTDRAIARRLGCCSQTVHRHRELRPGEIHEHWVKLRDLRAALTELINQGVRTVEIARKLGCDRKTVYLHRKRLAAENSVAA